MPKGEERKLAALAKKNAAKAAKVKPNKRRQYDDTFSRNGRKTSSCAISSRR